MLDCGGAMKLEIPGFRVTSPKTLAAWIGDDGTGGTQQVGWQQQNSPPSAFGLRRQGAGNIVAWSISTSGEVQAAGVGLSARIGPFIMWGTESSLNVLSRNGEQQTLADLPPDVLTDFVVGIQNAPMIGGVHVFDRILSSEERTKLFAWMEAHHVS